MDSQSGKRSHIEATVRWVRTQLVTLVTPIVSLLGCLLLAISLHYKVNDAHAAWLLLLFTSTVVPAMILDNYTGCD